MNNSVIAYLGLGANLGRPAETLAATVRAIREWPQTRCRAVSRLYHSAPMGPADQPDFCNAVVQLRTELSAPALLAQAQATERAFGRTRSDVRWGARSLDLDLLLYGDEVVQDADLVLPHPGLEQRAFVVFPLLDVAADLTLPSGRSLAEVARRLGQDGLLRVEAWAP
ncbi:2-amino-4-hydroxy-6-hydroxymethyldihydropteridine diphosphokinase [uncultured Abyssibacter sp.]|uniref:2-amino-4-hydroxy-6- hydroxymethyldihydropteridine diphosphokinase n=1 Tax=uncultured Abyssibacter sp. TaxID=2320202 RepID=UPI0032B2BE10